MFQLQVGSHEDESILLARYMAAQGVHTIGVVHDRSPIGRRHLDFLRDEGDRLGLRIAAAGISPLAEAADDETSHALKGTDALLYLGLGLSAPAVARAAAARAFGGPRAMNTAGIHGYQPDYADAIDGWAYVDMHADANAELNALCARFSIGARERFGAAKGWDMARLALEGIARADELTRAGIRHGLERVKWLAAAEGEAGTLLGFGPWDRGALHGRYLVMRQWIERETVQIIT